MWNVFSDYFMNAEKIFPTQQKDVYRIINEAKKYPETEKIIVFGSSVTSACNPWSDIDIYFQLSSPVICYNVVSKDVEAPVDKWDNFTVSDELYKEILENGVVVYERE